MQAALLALLLTAALVSEPGECREDGERRQPGRTGSRLEGPVPAAGAAAEGRFYLERSGSARKGTGARPLGESV